MRWEEVWRRCVERVYYSERLSEVVLRGRVIVMLPSEPRPTYNTGTLVRR